MVSREEKSLGKSQEKLKRDVERSVLKSADEILNIAEVAIADSQRYRAFRSKVLRSVNDAVREVKKNLDLHYKVVYVPTNEDVIEVQQPRVRS
ncbi:MAG: hypothetical protein GF334_01635 [Candidatus Altiarchaeales archaeon]|nr:hypothetical protein [Candidatus Altiarchaeales archaeon]